MKNALLSLLLFSLFICGTGCDEGDMSADPLPGTGYSIDHEEDDHAGGGSSSATVDCEICFSYEGESECYYEYDVSAAECASCSNEFIASLEPDMDASTVQTAREMGVEFTCTAE